MWNGPLADKVVFTKIKDHSTANTGDVTSDSVDMQGYDGVVFCTSYGTAAADNLFHAEQSSDDGAVDTFTDITGSELDLAGASDEDQVLDIFRPEERYVRVVAQRGTSSTLESIWAIRYCLRDVPADNDTSGTIASKILIEPVAGTK